MEPEKLAQDLALIEKHGGVSKLAELLGCSVQRVQNWTSRGIPADVKLEHPKLFLPHLTRQKARA